MGGFATKLIAGSPERKSRLHTLTGERVSMGRIVRNGVPALATGISRLLFDARPEKPWISYDAQKVIASHLRPAHRVLEFGSGMSTRWYARRSRQVHSIENDAPWFELVRGTLPPNATIVLAETREDYLAFPEQEYDLIMVDGRWRNGCIAKALPFLARGGILYLDNSDRAKYAPGIQLIEAFAKQHHCTVTRFVDFAPTQLFVQEGLMVKRP